jgi:23S rRNA (guanine745-N1)-methyltransferase
VNADVILKCPVCDGPLALGAKSAACERGHAFDVARSGYLNLLLPNQRHSPDPGDSPHMMRSRRAFLQAGFYEPAAHGVNAAVAEVLAGRERAAIADIGCGEGFFLAKLKAFLDAETPASVYRYFGVDISRTGVRMATTYDRKIAWIVASLHNSPFVAQSLDVAISMFSPIAPSDVRRIVRPDGALVIVTPGPDHLDALRAVIYPSVVPHSSMPTLMAGDTGFDLSRSTRVRYPISLTSASDITHLLAMTPYYWNISLETKARVEALTELDLTVDVHVTVFRPSARSL